MFGTEIRSISTQDDDRYKVLTGRNSVAYGAAIEKTMQDGGLQKAVKNLTVYMNPPYTSEDYVSKKSFEALSSNPILFGIFPTKSHKLLKHETDGIIIDIPREITGYTDPKTPERFLMFFGAKHSDMQESKASSLFGGSNSLPTNESSVFEMKDGESIDDAKKRLSFFIVNKISKLPFLVDRFKEQYNYYVSDSAGSRMNIVQNKFAKNMENFDNFLASVDAREKAIEDARESILKQFAPIEIAKNQKVFPDTRYYSGSDSPKMFYFKEVVSNVSLLNHYQLVSPNLFNVVREVADELKVKIPISIDPKEPFCLTQKNIPERKAFVTNSELGLMKSKYYPTLISLSEHEDKLELIDMFSSVSEKRYDSKMVKDSVEALKNVIEFADKMVLKNEQIIIESEGLLQNRECYILQDTYENDICKLNMSLTDFYAELQERGRFDIKDYVEVVKPSDKLKGTLVKNFIIYVENIARTIEQEPNLAKLNIIKDIFATRKTIGEKYKNFTNATQEFSKESEDYKKAKNGYNTDYRKSLLEFINKHKLDKHLEDKIVYPNINTLLNSIMKSDVFSNVRQQDKDAIKQKIHNRFIGREILFYEERMTEHDVFEPFLRNYGITDDKFDAFFYDLYDAVTPYFVAKKASINAYIKLASMMIVDYSKMKLMTLKGAKPEDIFDSSFKKMFMDTFELKNHQYEEAINTAAVDKKLSMLLWQMRSGKTLAMAATLFMTGLAKNNNMSLFVETANLQDISNQVFEYMPQMFFQMRVFHTEPKKILLNENIVYERLLSDKFYPNVLSILNKRDSDLIEGGGSTINKLKGEYNFKFETLLNKINTNNKTIEEAKILYSESPLIGILDICD